MTLFMVCWISLANPAARVCTDAIEIKTATILISHLHLSETFWITRVRDRDQDAKGRVLAKARGDGS